MRNRFLTIVGIAWAILSFGMLLKATGAFDLL